MSSRDTKAILVGGPEDGKLYVREGNADTIYFPVIRNSSYLSAQRETATTESVPHDVVRYVRQRWHVGEGLPPVEIFAIEGMSYAEVLTRLLESYVEHAECASRNEENGASMIHEQLIEEISFLAQRLSGSGVEGHEVEWVGWIRKWAEITVRHYKEQGQSSLWLDSLLARSSEDAKEAPKMLGDQFNPS